MADKNHLLKGAKSIQSAFDLNRDQFYTFVQLGMPVTKINGRWYAHYGNIDDWLRKITDPRHTKKRQITVDVREDSEFEDDDV